MPGLAVTNTDWIVNPATYPMTVMFPSANSIMTDLWDTGGMNRNMVPYFDVKDPDSFIVCAPYYFRASSLYAHIAGAGYIAPSLSSFASLTYQQPYPLHSLPVSDKLRVLFSMLGNEAMGLEYGVEREKFLKSFSSILRKVEQLDYLKISLELVNRKSVFFNIKFARSITVHLEVYITATEEVGTNSFYTLYQDKTHLRNGYGTIDVILSDILNASTAILGTANGELAYVA